MKTLLIGIFFVTLFAGCTTNGAQVVLQSIAFKPNEISIISGNVVQLAPVFTPSTFDGIAVDWSSTDATIATVSSSGILYAIKPGKVIVTIKDKNSATNGKCIVTVQ